MRREWRASRRARRGASRPEESRRGAGEVEAKPRPLQGREKNTQQSNEKEKVGGEEGGEEGRDEDEKGEGANKNV